MSFKEFLKESSQGSYSRKQGKNSIHTGEWKPWSLIFIEVNEAGESYQDMIKHLQKFEKDIQSILDEGEVNYDVEIKLEYNTSKTDYYTPYNNPKYGEKNMGEEFYYEIKDYFVKIMSKFGFKWDSPYRSWEKAHAGEQRLNYRFLKK